MSISRLLLRLLTIYCLFHVKKIETPLRSAINLPLVIAVHLEVESLVRVLYLDSIDNQLPKPANFAAYARSNLLYRPNQQRDTSRDLWGTPYRFKLSQSQYWVISAGPDRRFGTSDDIYSGRFLCACQ